MAQDAEAEWFSPLTATAYCDGQQWTRLNAREGVDFKLISIPHHCHKADIYLSSLFSTCDLRPWSQTPLEDESVSVLSVCKWSKVNGKAIIRY